MIVAVALVAHAAVLLIRGASRRILGSRLHSETKARTVSGFATSLITFGIYFAAFGFLLSELGISLATYLASASVIGLAVSFGFQGIVQDVITGLIQVFLAEKRFEGCGGLAVDDEMRLVIATQACILLLGRNTVVHPGLHTILVYPSSYVARARTSQDGIVSEGTSVRAGPTWSRGSLVLARDHVLRDAGDIHDGHNVAFPRVRPRARSRGRRRGRRAPAAEPLALRRLGARPGRRLRGPVRTHPAPPSERPRRVRRDQPRRVLRRRHRVLLREARGAGPRLPGSLRGAAALLPPRPGGAGARPARAAAGPRRRGRRLLASHALRQHDHEVIERNDAGDDERDA